MTVSHNSKKLQLTMYCDLRPPDAMPFRTENVWVLGTLVT